MKVFYPNNCPIIEETGDGIPVGRCWFALKEKQCSRHGDVSKEVEIYLTTGVLTPERNYIYAKNK